MTKQATSLLGALMLFVLVSPIQAFGQQPSEPKGCPIESQSKTWTPLSLTNPLRFQANLCPC